MKNIVVMADIHGNLPALDAVLRETAAFSPAAYLVLGDCFGELGQAAKVLERLSALGAFCIMGNRERDMLAYLKGERPQWENCLQLDPVTRSAREIASQAKILAQWPMTATLGEFRLCHGSVEDVYEILRPGLPRLDGMLRGIREPIMLSGHDHKQWAYALEGKMVYGVGSVGLSHCGQPCQAQYLVMTQGQESWQARFCRTAYDGAALTAIMQQSGWLEAGGPVARAAYEEAMTGGYGVLEFVRFAMGLCRRLLGEEIAPIPNEIIKEAARLYPWIRL